MNELTRLARDIFTESGVFALIAVVMVGSLILLIYTMYLLVKQRNNEGETTKTQAEVIAQLVKPITTIAEKMEVTSANLLKVVQLMNTYDARVTDLRTMLDDAVGNMEITATHRDQQLNELPGKVREEMSEDFRQLPKAIEEALAPRILTLQAEIRDLVNSLESKLSSQIEASTDPVPARTAELLRADLSRLSTMIEQFLSINNPEKDTPDGSE